MAKPRRNIQAILVLMACLGQATALLRNNHDWPKGETKELLYDWGSEDGYNLFAPVWSTDSFIVDNKGEILHKWEEPDGYELGGSSYLSEEGTLLRNAYPRFDYENDEYFEPFGKVGGLLREYNKEGHCLWEFYFLNTLYRLKSEFIILPNGNLLVSALKLVSLAEAREKGYNGPGMTYPYGLVANVIIEIPRDSGLTNTKYDPDSKDDYDAENTCMTFSTEDQIIWEWDSFEHSSKDLSHPTWDVNNHLEVSGMDYLPSRDHIIFVCEPCGEVFVIDHSVEASEISSEKGDFIYRWGNPANYGKEGKMTLSASNVRWIRDNFGWEYDQEGAVLIYNNNDPRLIYESVFSTVQFTPPFENGKYLLQTDGTFGPTSLDLNVKQVKGELTTWKKMIDSTEEIEKTIGQSLEDELYQAGVPVYEEEEEMPEAVEEEQEAEKEAEEEQEAEKEVEEEQETEEKLEEQTEEEEETTSETNPETEELDEDKGGRLLKSDISEKHHDKYDETEFLDESDIFAELQESWRPREFRKPKPDTQFGETKDIKDFPKLADINILGGKKETKDLKNYEEFEGFKGIEDPEDENNWGIGNFDGFGEVPSFGSFGTDRDFAGFEDFPDFGGFGDAPHLPGFGGFGTLKDPFTGNTIGNSGIFGSIGKFNNGFFGNTLQYVYSEEFSSVQKLPNGHLIVASNYELEVLEQRIYDIALWKYAQPFTSGSSGFLPEVDFGFGAPSLFGSSGFSDSQAVLIKYSKQFKGFDKLFPQEDE